MSNPSTFKTNAIKNRIQLKMLKAVFTGNTNIFEFQCLQVSVPSHRVPWKRLKERKRWVWKFWKVEDEPPRRFFLYSSPQNTNYILLAARICLTTDSCHLTYVTNSRCDCSCRFLQQCLKYRQYSTTWKQALVWSHLFLKLRLPLGLDRAVCLLLVCRN